MEKIINSQGDRFNIMARKSDGSEFHCFTWTRDAASGIRRAYSDAKNFGVEVIDVWAVDL